MSALTLITPPTVEPLTLAETKLHLRVDYTADDALITSLIIAARQAAETKTGRALLPQTWKLSLNAFPYSCNLRYRGDVALQPSAERIKLPRPPFVSLSSITYVDLAGVQQTLGGAAYTVGQLGALATVRPAYGTSWPTARDDDNAVNITFNAGYASASLVPEPIKAWMKIMIGTLYENREAILHGQGASPALMPRGFSDGLLDPYRIAVTA